MQQSDLDALFLASLKAVPGILDAQKLRDEDRDELLEIERKAEEQSLMSLGKVVNVGVRTVLECPGIFVVLNSMDFDWGKKSTLLMKKGDEIVGEEVRDPERIAQLSARDDVWFMHKHFAVYKERISFPQDIMQKICYFEIPFLSADWNELQQCRTHCRDIIFSFPSTPGDTYLKDEYFQGRDERGTGTCLVGIY